MICIESEKDILGLPQEETKLRTQLSHRSTLTEENYTSTGFLFSEVKEKKEDEIVVEILKPKRNDRRKKPSTLF
jgi:hypothetical protein